MNCLKFYKKKQTQEKISMITCYDYTSARLLSETSVDALLVGDSVAMTMHGYKDTVAATLPMMCMHTRAVAKGAPNKFIIGDLPFLSYRKSLSKSVSAAQSLMQAGANAIKLESVAGNIKLIKHLVESGIPVMGHIGLTMQLINTLGGLKVQGKLANEAERIMEDAQLLEEAGCFSVVLECIPAALAERITQQLKIATIGIGAGSATDGQVLVWQDLLGFNIDFKPKFVKNFVNGYEQVKSGVAEFINDVQSGVFPSVDHSYLM